MIGFATGRTRDTTARQFSIVQRTSDCGPCPRKAKCCPKAPCRKIPRSIHEDARDVARALAYTEAFEQSRRDRKRVEMLFAHLKRIDVVESLVLHQVDLDLLDLERLDKALGLGVVARVAASTPLGDWQSRRVRLARCARRARCRHNRTEATGDRRPCRSGPVSGDKLSDTINPPQNIGPSY